MVDAASELGLPLLGQPGTVLEGWAVGRGVRYIAEGFPDRRYRDDGSLVPRERAGCHPARPRRDGRLRSFRLIAGGRVATLCIHGDDPRAVDNARLVRQVLEGQGIAVRSFTPIPDRAVSHDSAGPRHSALNSATAESAGLARWPRDSLMSWREKVLLWTGPGLFAGITFGDWMALLRENRFAIDPAYWWRAAVITLGSLGNSLIRRREEAAYGQRIAATEVEPPLFVLGIWRSGTTHLQNLLAVDRRFATPNWYQVSYPHTFLNTEATSSRLGASSSPGGASRTI